MTEESLIPQPPFSDPCVIHDPITFRGGGEQYAAQLANTLNAPLYTYRKDDSVSLDIEVDIREFGSTRYFDKKLMELPFRGFTRAIEYENFEVPKHHDAVITTGATSKAVIHRPYQRRYHLLHTPARWLFDLGPSQYEHEWWPICWVKRGFQSLMRIHDQSTIPRIDDFVVNSEVIARRLQTYHRREETAIIYPPIDVSSYKHEPSEGFLLYLGRLEPHKRVSEIVDAVTGTQYELRIAGTGSTEENLREIAGDNVTFLGFVSEKQKRELLARCDALLFNSEHEDFGIVPVEAMASGNPVIGVNEGFTKYQIEDGVNGVLYERGVENMRDAIDRTYNQEWDVQRIQESTDKYGMERFENEWRSIVYSEES